MLCIYIKRFHNVKVDNLHLKTLLLKAMEIDLDQWNHDVRGGDVTPKIYPDRKKIVITDVL